MNIFDLAGGNSRRGGGMSPTTLALLGLLAYRTLKGKGPLADLLGKATGSSVPPSAGAAPASSTNGTTGSAGSAGPGGLGGLLGGILGGGALSGGLKDLLDRFRQSGHEQVAQSWVASGANQSLTADQLEQALGDERVQWLMDQTGMPKQELLAGLSTSLPGAVDKLTPDGRIPTDEELARHLSESSGATS